MCCHIFNYIRNFDIPLRFLHTSSFFILCILNSFSPDSKATCRPCANAFLHLCISRGFLTLSTALAACKGRKVTSSAIYYGVCTHTLFWINRAACARDVIYQRGERGNGRSSSCLSRASRTMPTYVRDCNSARPDKYYMHALSPVIYNKPRGKICCRTWPICIHLGGGCKKVFGRVVFFVDQNGPHCSIHLQRFSKSFLSYWYVTSLVMRI